MQQPPLQQYPPYQAQQPPYYPPPQQPYFQPPPYYQPPMMPPPKPSHTGRNWLIVLAVISVLLICGGIANTTQSQSSNTTVQATDTPASFTSNWTTVQTFSGYLSEKTAFFTIQKKWRISWSCTNSDVPPGDTGSFLVIAYDYAGHTISGDDLDPAAASGDCPVADAPTTGIGPVQKHGGTIYLDVAATGDWMIEVQVLK